jgi:hypothetical protein
MPPFAFFHAAQPSSVFDTWPTDEACGPEQLQMLPMTIGEPGGVFAADAFPVAVALAALPPVDDEVDPHAVSAPIPSMAASAATTILRMTCSSVW